MIKRAFGVAWLLNILSISLTSVVGLPVGWLAAFLSVDWLGRILGYLILGVFLIFNIRRTIVTLASTVIAINQILKPSPMPVDRLGVRDAWNLGMPYVGETFKFNIVVGVLGLLAAGFCGGLILLLGLRDLGGLMVFAILFLPASAVLVVLYWFGFHVVLLENAGVGDGLKRGWEMFRKHTGEGLKAFLLSTAASTPQIFIIPVLQEINRELGPIAGLVVFAAVTVVITAYTIAAGSVIWALAYRRVMPYPAQTSEGQESVD